MTRGKGVRRWSRALALGALVSARPAAGQASVSGTVFDSVAGKPMRGATVRFVGVNDPAQVRTVFSDSSGRYAIAAIPPGRYLAGFAHPLLDSLGYDPPPGPPVFRRIAVQSTRKGVVIKTRSGYVPQS